MHKKAKTSVFRCWMKLFWHPKNPLWIFMMLKLKKNILKKLYSNKAFSKGHLLYESLTSEIPSHLAGFVDKVLMILLRRA